MNKARQRLFLSAERAFGLESIRRPEMPAGEAAPAGKAVHAATEVADIRGRSAAPAAALKKIPALNKPAPASSVTDGSMLLHVDRSTPFTSEILPTGEKTQRLKVLDDTQVKGCTRCRLSHARTQTVFGEGNVDAKLMFIGEGPGENEDLSGRPFVGRAGQLLDKMIGAMGLQRSDVYIANVVKCRPPNNRAPMPDETAACTPYLLTQIETIRPEVIVTLGLPATKFILQLDLSMGRMRGQFHDWRGIKVMPTYHPSYVLRSYTPQTRAAVWGDLQQVMKLLGLKAPEKKSESI